MGEKVGFPSIEHGSGTGGPRSPIPLVAPFNSPQPGMKKIGSAAAEAGISVQTIRLYEAEGLLISFKSAAGTRWYNEQDLKWIVRIKELLSQGLNLEGVRWLLAQIPCWALRPCAPAHHSACSMRHENKVPCWTAPDRLCTEKLKECYHCNTYRRAREFVNLKAHAEIVPIR